MPFSEGVVMIFNKLKINKTYVKVFISAVAIHWLILALVFIIFANTEFTEKNIFEACYDRYIECGDTPHYINIATNGYSASGENANEIVFYPLYPILMRILAFFIKDYFISGVLISNVCLGVSACFLYKLTKLVLEFIAQRIGFNAQQVGFVAFRRNGSRGFFGRN